MQSFKQYIRSRALALGFDAVGFAAPALPGHAAQGLREYLGERRHGDMAWMEANAERRADPLLVWPQAQSVIMLGHSYAPDFDVMERLLHRNNGVISAYALNRDYHDVMKKKLRVLAAEIAKAYQAECKIFVDTAPVMEKPLAEQAGIGWQGKHSCVVSREHGSWLFLSAIFTTLCLEPDPPHDFHCGSCTQCLDVCPTDAFIGPGKLDARRCIAYLTIEHKGHIPREFREAIGNRVYGCDDCLAVCPWNKFAASSREAAYHAREELRAPPLAELARLDDAAFRRLFSGSPVKRTGRDRFIRNVLISIGNSGDPALLEVVEPFLEDASELVRAMAVWAVSRLAPEKLAGLRRRYLPQERDEDVRAEWTAA